MQDLQRSRLFVASVQCFGFFAFGFSSTLLGPSLNSIIRDFRLGSGLAGLLGSAMGLGALSSFIGGSLSDRYGRTTGVSVSLAFLLVAMLLAGLSVDYPILFLGLVIAGAGLGLYESASNPLVSEIFPTRRSWIINLTHSFQGVGSFIGPVVAGLVLVVAHSWRPLYLLTAVIVVAALSLALFLKSKHNEVTGRKTESRNVAILTFSLFRSRAIVILGLATLFEFAAELGISVWLSAYLQASKGFDQFWGGITVGLFWGAVALGRAFLGKPVEKIGLASSLVIFPALSTILAVMGLAAAGLWSEVIIWTALGFCMATIYPNILAATCLAFPTRAGAACGSVYALGIVGSIASPALIGGFTQIYSLGSAMILVVISLVLVAGFAGLLSRQKREINNR